MRLAKRSPGNQDVQPSGSPLYVWAVVAIALAAFLRLAYLDQIPSCLEYDEAANVILAGEIARGQAHPLFIRAYTGKEVLYFYLAAGMIRLVGESPFALRLTSAYLGILTVALACWFTRELFATGGLDRRQRRWLAVFSAALIAVSYWQVQLGRFGYRAISLPPMLALSVGLLMRGLRREQVGCFVAAGAAAGLSAYTYSSVRVYPILLLLVWTWVLIADRRRWRQRLGQMLAFGLAAAAVFAPLGVFFLRNPATFSVRLSQVSVLNPAVHRGDLAGALLCTARMAFGMFTAAGDLNPLYNSPGKPVFDHVLGLFFYLGGLICAWRLFRHPRVPEQTEQAASGTPAFPALPSFVLLSWLVVMMVPNILSASGVPQNLRAMALVPAVYVVVAVGIVTPLFAGLRYVPRAPLLARPVALALCLLTMLGFEGRATYDQYVHDWAGSAPPYYKGNEALLHAARLIDAHPEATPYVATYFFRHATLAVSSSRYQQIHWIGKQTLVLPPPDAGPALLIHDHTTPVDPLLRARYLPPGPPFHRELGPDGQIGFEAYWLDATNHPASAPQFPMQVDMGHTLAFLGYDLNAPPRSGDALDVTLYLRVLRQVEQDDWALFVHLSDDLGFRWGGDTFFVYPSREWRPGETWIVRRQIGIAPGAPPGTYTLDIGAFSATLDARLPVLNDAGQMAGTVVQVGPIEIARASAPPSTWPPIQQPAEAAWGDDLTFLGSDRDRSDLRAGETLALTLYWQASQSPAQPYTVRVWLAGLNLPGFPEPGSPSISLWDGPPVHGLYPFTQWQPGEFVRDRYALRLPLTAIPGDYALYVALLDDGGRALALEDGAASVSLGTIHLHATDRTWEPPTFAHAVGARLGNQVELLGYDLDRSNAHPGETLHLTLVWRCEETMDIAYTVFTHLLGPGDQVRGQQDNPPVRGTYPTTLWLPGEIVVDPFEIAVAADAAPGQYAIEVGLYDPRTMQRLPVQDPTGAVGDRVLLADIQIVLDR